MTTQAPCWDTLINDALVFDGTGNRPERLDIAIADGKIAAKGRALPQALAKQVVDGSEQYLMPGLLDIHTHLDLEVELEPGLPEAVRHGTTTVLVGNCSLGLSYGAQQKDGADPVVDCFARVENVPKKVLSKCVDAIKWQDSKQYMEHFDELALGPNIAAFIPHSMLRIEVMGLQDSVSREPTEAELQQMEALVEKGIDEGYMGISTDGLPFHYLANSPNTDVRIPTQHGSFAEYKRLLKVVRDRGRVWQTTAIIENKIKLFRYFALTSGLLHGKPLKTSALTAVEFSTFKRAVYVFLRFASLMNSKLFKGRMHFQALGTRFRIWSDGVISPLYEELPATCKLNAVELEDSETRHRMLNDPDFIEEFRHDWYLGRRGWTLSTLKARIGVPDMNVVREPERLVFDGAPVTEWNGETFLQVMQRVQRYQHGYANAARSDAERDAFERFPDPMVDDADFMLHM
ncbi:MAG: amidohydrolase family protein, partial [Pseudomonadales bacterium]|nr:amidohydrolase family protein [Pseudomonadales bacterium]